MIIAKKQPFLSIVFLLLIISFSGCSFVGSTVNVNIDRNWSTSDEYSILLLIESTNASLLNYSQHDLDYFSYPYNFDSVILPLSPVSYAQWNETYLATANALRTIDGENVAGSTYELNYEAQVTTITNESFTEFYDNQFPYIDYYFEFNSSQNSYIYWAFEVANETEMFSVFEHYSMNGFRVYQEFSYKRRDFMTAVTITYNQLFFVSTSFEITLGLVHFAVNAA